MNLCKRKHEEICYVVSHCPMCGIMDELQDEMNSSKSEIKKLQATIEVLKNERR